VCQDPGPSCPVDLCFALNRRVALTAWTNSTSSHALIVVRSNVGRSPTTLRSCGMAGLFKPVLTLTVEYRHAESASGFRDADNVVNQLRPVHGCNRIHLHRLIVDDDECRVLRREAMILNGVSNRFTGLCFVLSVG
jgi:hypothetical protein